MDTQGVIITLRSHLKAQLRTVKRQGFVIGLSGGIDSAVTAHLAAEAVGPDNVLGVVLPERENSPESRDLGLAVAAQLGIRCEDIDITAQLAAAQAYEKRDAVVRRYFPDYDPAVLRIGISLRQDLVGGQLPGTNHLILLDAEGQLVAEARINGPDYLAFVAATNFKQRARAMQLYYLADREHYAVLGTTNRDELLLGFFVKLGDGAADVEAIDVLYKGEVYALARALGVDQRIIDRPPTTDTLPGQATQADYFYGLPFETLDVALAELEGEAAPAAVTATGLDAAQMTRLVSNLRRRHQTTHILRTPPISLERAALVGVL